MGRQIPLIELTRWRTLEFMREPEAIFWIFAFPVLLSLALGIAFKNRPPQEVSVIVREGAGAQEVAANLTEYNLDVEIADSVAAASALRVGAVPLVVVPGPPITIWYDSTRQESHYARLVVNNALQSMAGRDDPLAINEIREAEPGARYIDFLVPGLLGMNIMGTGIWGVGFGIAQARQRKLLKRFVASPMRKHEYLMGLILSRLTFLGFEVAAVLGFGVFVFDVPVRGSIIALVSLIVLAALSFGGLGVLVGSRARTIEGVSGVMNLVMMPMWIFSGIFFSSQLFPDAIQPYIRMLPLTAVNDGLRAIMLEGAGLVQVAGFMAIVTVWGLVTFGMALKIFRWT